MTNLLEFKTVNSLVITLSSEALVDEAYDIFPSAQVHTEGNGLTIEFNSALLKEEAEGVDGISTNLDLLLDVVSDYSHNFVDAITSEDISKIIIKNE